MWRRIALAILAALLGLGLIIAAPAIPMTRLGPVAVALGCVALVLALTIATTLGASAKAAAGMCVLVVGSLALVVAGFELAMPYRNHRVATTADLWNPREGALDHVEKLDFTYNRDGWRTARQLAEFRAGTDIALVGDSIVYGIVSDEDTIESHLRALLRRTGSARDVLTVAVPGAGLIAYEELSRIAAKMRPAWTYLFVYVDNDFNQPRQFDLPRLTRFLDTSSTLRALSVLPALLRRWSAPPPRAGEGSQRAMPEAAPADELRRQAAIAPGVNRGLLRSIPTIDEALYGSYARTASHPEVARIFERINRELDGRLCVVLVPSKYQVFVGYEWVLKELGYRPTGPLPSDVQRVLERTLTRLGICVIEPHRAVIDGERSGRLYHSVDDHLNGAGNCLLAGQILADLGRRGMVEVSSAHAGCPVPES